MGRNLSKVFLPLLLLLKISNCQSAAEMQMQLSDEPTHQKEVIGSSFADLIRHISKQDVRISKLESRGKQQEQEMSDLKATVDDDKKEIFFLKNRVQLLETSTKNTFIPDEEHHSIIPRPARLLPAAILR